MANNGTKLVDDGIHKMCEGDYNKAESLFNEAISIGKGEDLSYAYYNKGILMEKHLNNMEEALHCYETAASFAPVYKYVWNNFGNMLLHFNEYEEALAAFEEALELTPNETRPLYNIAYTYNRLNNFQRAINILRKLLNMEVENEFIGKINSELGLALLKTNNIHEAYGHFEKAFQEGEQSYQVYYNIAFISDMLKKYDKALLFYDKAIALNKNESKGYQGKACTYIHTEKYEEGLVFIKKAIVLSPSNFEGYYNLACIYAGLRKEEELLKSIQKTIDLAPSQIGIEKHIQNDPDFLPYSKLKEFLSILEKTK